jgi:prevent-host-death family protein
MVEDSAMPDFYVSYRLDLVHKLVYYRIMATVNIHEAKTFFSRLLNRVESGEEIIIAKAGKPVARIVPLCGKTEKRMPGTAKGQILIGENFFEPLADEVLKTFEN